MTDVIGILNAIEQGDAKAADELNPLVYEELRLLAARKMSHESPGQTLQATALVHEAYIRLSPSRFLARTLKMLRSKYSMQIDHIEPKMEVSSTSI